MASASIASPLQIPQTKNHGTTQTPPAPLTTGQDVRLAARTNSFSAVTSGVAKNYLQANLLILPSRYANDFRLLCARNPVPCPLIAESSSTGKYDAVKSCIANISASQILSDVDIRRDAPAYNVYQDSRLIKQGCADIAGEWTDDHVAFLIGCSYSFESALAASGLVPRHTELGRNVSIYRTNMLLCPAGVFSGSTYVVSMRPYKAGDIERVRKITRGFNAMHGEPLAWGWDAVEKLGIRDINLPDWGEAPLTADGRPLGQVLGDEDEVPVFWGCGVTPQEAVMKADIKGVVMAHAPGHMLLLDIKDDDIVPR